MRMSPVQLLDRVRKLPNTPDLIEGYRFAVIMTWKIDTTEQDKELRDFSAKHSEITDYHKVLCVGTVKNRGLEAQEWQIYVGGLKNHESHMKWEGVPTNATLQFMGKVAKTDREITEIGELLFNTD